MQDEVAKHTKKIYQAARDPKHGLWEKMKEITIEIFIIVFAVTLSIWFHNWSDHRHEQKESNEFLKGLKDDLARDIRLLEDNKQAAARLDSNFKFILALNDSKAIDTISARELSNRLQFELNATHAGIGRYEGFKSSGKIGTIENDSLKQSILVYYQQTIPAVDDVEGVVNSFQTSILNMEVDKNDKLPIKDLLKSFKMYARLQFVTINLKGELEAYATAQKQAARIISMIDQESQHSRD